MPTWPTSNRILGVVSAVSFDNSGNVVIFHRSNNLWDSSTFNQENVYQHQSNGPIKDNTIIAFNRISGDVAYEWGNNMFYMPHGITVDREDNIWLTDVALHQVMKFNDKNRTHPEFVLGTQFKPGHSHTTFCKPTAVAVIANGDFFVADGYCNSRIIKYSKSGEFLLEWGKNSFGGPALNHAPPNYFAIPHALTLANDLNLLCVADRENGRVQCFNIDDGKFHFQFHSPIIGDRLFSVAYAPVNNGQLFVVNGPSLDSIPHPVVGFVIDMKSHDVISKFGPFENPHDIIVSLDGQEVDLSIFSNIFFCYFQDILFVYRFTLLNSIQTKHSNLLDIRFQIKQIVPWSLLQIKPIQVYFSLLKENSIESIKITFYYLQRNGH